MTMRALLHELMRTKWVIPVVILLVAIAFRFYALDSTPPGLFFDEAIEGNQALEAVATGHLEVFYPENYGREGLFVWLATIPLTIFGNYPWALRSVSAVFGVLTVIGLYLLTRSVFDEKIGLISSFLLATSFWHTNFSRIGFRAILAPFFVVWMLYFLFRGLDRGRLYDFVLSGLACGLGFYSYIPFRTMPVVLLVAALAHWRNSLKGLCILVFTAAIIALPLAWHFYAQPHDFSNRMSQVSISSSSQLLSNLGKTAGMFNYAGDTNPRHNYSASPTLPITIGIFFVFGLIGTIVKSRKSSVADVTMLAWFFIGLVPVVLSDAAPHALRALIVAPVVYAFASEGIWWIYRYVEERTHVSWLPVAVASLLVATMFLEGYKYFVEWAHQPIVGLAFFKDDVRIGEVLNTMPHSRPVYVYVAPTHNYETVHDIPINAQTLMFITDTYTSEKQRARKIRYATAMPDKIPPDTVVVSLY